MLRCMTSAAMGAAILMAAPAYATTTFSQGFETDTAGWLDGDDFTGYGQITRSDSATAYEGDYFGVVSSEDAGPFTRFDGYRTDYPGDWKASIAIYLDPDVWGPGAGFEYSVATNDAAGGHRRDFVFQVAKDADTGTLLVNASNNATQVGGEYVVADFLDTRADSVVIASAGWYVFEHAFSDIGGGVLGADLSVYDSSASTVFSKMLSNPTDVIGSTVGGNRYGFFSAATVEGGVMIDDVQLDVSAVPLPLGLPMIASAFGLAWLGRRTLKRA